MFNLKIKVFFLCEPLIHAWDFENDDIIDSYEENPTWIFTEKGIWTVKLIVIGLTAYGQIADTLVRENYIHVCEFTAGFKEDKYSGCPPFTVNFTDTSQVTSTEIFDRLWDFNDDGIIDSHDKSPEWIYNQPGMYAVKLIINDSSGFLKDTVIKLNLIEIFDIETRFMVDKKYGPIPFNVSFIDLVVLKIK